MPTDLSELKPYFPTLEPPLDDGTLDAIFSRYKMLHTGNISDLPPDAWLIAEKKSVDKDYDTRANLGDIGRRRLARASVKSAILTTNRIKPWLVGHSMKTEKAEIQQSQCGSLVRIAAVTFFILALYLLSTGPLWWLHKHGVISKPAFTVIYRPIGSLIENSPGDVFCRYIAWWSPVIGCLTLSYRPGVGFSGGQSYPCSK